MPTPARISNPETHRRSMMKLSDDLLDEVEELRLSDRRRVPEELVEAIRDLQSRLSRKAPPTSPATLRAAHDLVFAVQARLMAANPRHPAPHSRNGRPQGQPTVISIGDGRSWKCLSLPPLTATGSTEEWHELVEAIVERAYERWLFTYHQLTRSARSKEGTKGAWAQSQAAWSNYWELSRQARRLRRPGYR